MECFQRPPKTIINNYLAGKITELELIEKLNRKTVGIRLEIYAPILQYAKTHRLTRYRPQYPNMNNPPSCQTGLESLIPAQLQYIPRSRNIDRTNDAYRDILFDFIDTTPTTKPL